MKILTSLVGILFLTAACAPVRDTQKQAYQVTCHTHARTASFSGSPDEQAHYLECMKIKGRHDVEVSEIE